MKNLATLTALAILLPFQPLGAEDTKPMLPDEDKSKLTLKSIFSTKEFKDENFSRPRWWSEGSNYTTLQELPDGDDEELIEGGEDEQDSKRQAREIHWHDAASGESELLVSAAQLTPNSNGGPLQIDDYTFTDDRKKLLIFTNSKKVWRYKTRGDYWVLDLTDRSLKQLGGAEGSGSRMMFATFSPDASKVAFVLEHNLYVQDLATLDVTAITADGSDTIINGTFDWVYEEELKLHKGFRWSPDSQSLAYWQLDQAGVPVVNLVNNTDELYPRLIPIHYPKAGQQNPSARVGVVQASGSETRWIDVPGDPREHYIADLGWIEDTGELYLQQLNRLQNTLLVMIADPQSGSTSNIHTDRDDAWIDIEQKLRWIRNGSHYLTLSERDGWRHLYLVSSDAQTEPLLLTDGEFDVTDIAGIDEEAGHVYFIASPHDPLRRYLYSVDLDGKDVRRITPETYRGTNAYQISKDGRHAIHSHSTFDSPDATQIINLPEHKVIDTLADNESLRERFAQIDPIAHEFFRVDIGDGVELDGWSLKPSDFDPEKKYPVLFHVYGEPAGQVVRDRWGGRTALWHRMLAQQGTIVIAVDNRGTPSPRGREFRKSIYRQIGVLASADQAAAVRSLLEQRAYLDPDRVGIWGWSGGGSMTLNALFRYPELYQIGISVAPVPDMRLYDTIYQERYMGLPADNEDGYRDGSPIHYAENLTGDLMLIHGTGDDNCHYQGTELLINELIKHNKPFSMFAYPNRSHSISEGKNTSLHLFGLMSEYLEKNH